MQKFAIIAAGGIGKRMDSHIPKQFLTLCGFPVLMHTISAFHRASSDISILLALPSPLIKKWKPLCKKYNFSIPCKIVAGGDTRTRTISNCLKILPESGIVAIHDGVRPLIKSKIILESFHLAGKKGSAVTAVPLKESIRKIISSRKTTSRAVNREKFFMVQTPQTFRLDWLHKAYSRVGKKEYSDDATVVENAGFPIYLLMGDYENIKITTKEDMAVAERLMEVKDL